MRLEKRYELQKNRLARMESQVDELKNELAKSEENRLQFESLNDELRILQEEWINMLDDLKIAEDIRMKEWQDQINLLKKQRMEYSVLLKQLAVITKI